MQRPRRVEAIQLAEQRASGEGGVDVYRLDVVMLEREQRRKEEEGRRSSRRGSIANPRMNSACKLQICLLLE